ncbi:MAG: hypothetical protein IJV73_04295 [Clostridia bacterium]|nr:hypothetical protein [Clostridia bacterium]
MQDTEKKQFSLSLLVRIFLGLLVVISIGVFARSIMQYNELNREALALEDALDDLGKTRARLIEDLGSADELNRILNDYQAYKELIEADTATSDALAEYQTQLENIRELLNSSKNKDYIVRIAKDELNLYFADEEIIYNDID